MNAESQPDPFVAARVGLRKCYDEADLEGRKLPCQVYLCQLMPTPLTDPTKATNPAPGSRLDSWKEIAAFLCRGERTVKRWETDRGLPVHRVPGGRGSVYAYSGELDEWLSSSPELETAEPDASIVELIPSEQVEQVEDAEPGSFADTPTIDLASPDWPSAQPESAVGQAELTAVMPIHRKRGWWLAGAALVLVGVATGVLWVSAVRDGRFLSRDGIQSLLAGNSGNPHSANGSAVSERDRSQAHELYLKGRYEWSERTPDSLNQALDSFTQAIVHDPGNAQAYVGLADTYNLLHIYSTLPLEDSYPRAIAAAKRAVELNDALPEAHRALAFAEFYGAGNWVESEKEFRRAIELNPNDPVTRRWYANAFAIPGRYDEAMRQFDKSLELDPASHSTLCDKAMVLFNFGKTEEAIALLKEVERTDPQFFSAHLYLAMIAFEKRDYPTFLDEGQKAADTRSDPVFREIIASTREAYTKQGESGLLKEFYRKQKEYYDEGKYPPGLLSIACVAIGKRQEAITLLEFAYDHHEPAALWGLTDPVLRTLKDEPRYRALVKRINFPVLGAGSPKTSLAMDSAAGGDSR